VFGNLRAASTTKLLRWGLSKIAAQPLSDEKDNHGKSRNGRDLVGIEWQVNHDA